MDGQQSDTLWKHTLPEAFIKQRTFRQGSQVPSDGHTLKKYHRFICISCLIDWLRWKTGWVLLVAPGNFWRWLNIGQQPFLFEFYSWGITFSNFFWWGVNQGMKLVTEAVSLYGLVLPSVYTTFYFLLPRLHPHNTWDKARVQPEPIWPTPTWGVQTCWITFFGFENFQPNFSPAVTFACGEFFWATKGGYNGFFPRKSCTISF